MRFGFIYFTSILIGASFTSTAFASFPDDELGAAAKARFIIEARQPKSALGRAHKKMLAMFPTSSPDTKIDTRVLAEISSQSNVTSDVFVQKTYREITAGGRFIGSITAVSRVELRMEPNSGKVISTGAQIEDRTVHFNFISE